MAEDVQDHNDYRRPSDRTRGKKRPAARRPLSFDTEDVKPPSKHNPPRGACKTSSPTLNGQWTELP